MALTLKTKKRLTTLAQAIFFFFGGVEYAVVLPTLNAYIGSLGGDAMFFGIVMASFSFSGILVGPLFGAIQDRIQKTKVLILFANLWEVGGNFLYFAGGSKYALLGSRLISGVGAGVGSAIFAQISITTTEKDRAAALAIASAARQIGLLIGPAINLPLSYCDFYIGPFHVNSFTGPGLIMSILFILLEIITLFCFYDIPPLDQQVMSDEDEALPNPVTAGSIQDKGDATNYGTVQSSKDDGLLYDAHAGEDSTATSRRLNGGRVVKDAVENSESPSGSGQVEPKTFSRLDVILREEVMVLLAAQFVFLFNQTCLETSLTVMTKQLLDFNGFENSILYAVAGTELIISLIIIRFISKFISDRTMILGSLTLEIVPYILLLIFYPHAIPGRDRNLWWFTTLFVIQVSGLGFLFISIVSLFSKVTPAETQGFTHGIRRAFGGLGTIMGPLWAGSIEHWPFETLTVMMVLFILIWGMTVLSWKRLRPHSFFREATRGPSNTPEENKPLLINADESDYGVA